MKIGNQTFNFNLSRLNSTKFETKPTSQTVINEDYNITITTLPRNESNLSKVGNSNWDRKASVFRNFQEDSEVLLISFLILAIITKSI